MDRRSFVAIGFFTALVGCGAAQTKKTSLFERLGGMQKITAAAEEVVNSVSQDSRTKRTFAGINLKTLKASVAVHLCAVTGGPCRYEGESMANAHSGLNLNNDEFSIMGDYVDRAFARQGVNANERKELATLLENMRAEVVAK
jgi:hemoglobin